MGKKEKNFNATNIINIKSKKNIADFPKQFGGGGEQYVIIELEQINVGWFHFRKWYSRWFEVTWIKNIIDRGKRALLFGLCACTLERVTGFRRLKQGGYAATGNTMDQIKQQQ